MTTSKVAVVGAGMAGLAAAERLISDGFDVSVYEAGAEPGGRAATEEVELDGLRWRFDRGAEFVGSFYTAALELVRTAGFGDSLVRMPIDSTVILDGTAYRLPSDPIAILRTPLLGWRSKLRALALGTRLAVRRAPNWGELASYADLDDRSAAAELRSTVGTDYAERVLRATLDALALTPSDTTSRLIALSQLRHAANSRLLCPPGGLGVVTETLAKRFPIEYDSRVTNLADLDTDQVVLAVPPSVARTLLPSDHPDRALAERARFNTAVKLHLALDTTIPGLRPTCPVGPGHHPLAGINPLSAKGTNQVPEGCEGLEICAAPWLGEQLLEQSDDQVTQCLTDHAERLLGRRIGPFRAVKVIRLPEGVPLFDVGWLRRLRERRSPGPVVAAGDWLSSPSLEGAVRSGRAAADAIHAQRRS